MTGAAVADETDAAAPAERDGLGRFAPGNPWAGQGKPKGAQDWITRDMKRMIARATELAGERLSDGRLKGEDAAVEYLAQQAVKHPKSFLPLLAKCLPRETRSEVDAGPGLLDLLNRSWQLERERKTKEIPCTSHPAAPAPPPSSP